ncbi:MAG TPA: hypothetical protein VFX59_19150, partial [Polyangiales bacterium]|nr:hypothetical protein [Polyangiales bacterium]
MRREIFLALTLVATACGDDSSSDDSNDNEETDAGGGSSELEEAQRTSGVSATQARATLLIDAVCTKAPTCGSSTSVSACKATSNASWQNLVDNKADDVCKDAELDRYACLSTSSCEVLSNAATACKSFQDAIA